MYPQWQLARLLICINRFHVFASISTIASLLFRDGALPSLQLLAASPNQHAADQRSANKREMQPLEDTNPRSVLSSRCAFIKPDARSTVFCEKVPLQIDLRPFSEPLEPCMRRPLVCLSCAAVLSKHSEVRPSGECVCVFCGAVSPALPGGRAFARANDVARIPGTVLQSGGAEAAAGGESVRELYPELSRDELCFEISANAVETVPHWSTATASELRVNVLVKKAKGSLL